MTRGGRIRQHPLPALERLHALLRLDAATGELFWRERPRSAFAKHALFVAFNAQRAGTRAGSIRCGYRRVEIDGNAVNAHWIVWAMVHGRWPSEEIDHRDGLKDDNRPSELREATRAQNQLNVGLRANNTSGHKWVHWSPKQRRWIAQVPADGKRFRRSFRECADAVAFAAGVAAQGGEFVRVVP